jgi:hypothetical protein
MAPASVGGKMGSPDAYGLQSGIRRLKIWNENSQCNVRDYRIRIIFLVTLFLPAVSS